ncbi:hypothetical protein SAMN02745673_02420 [Marinactinospora thermotolerans DSM 45154]|uniref:Uncharacterized protein n=1 Tax=Marinactinospora thermotolerans DSM 45154 TaxID=1122192 RepID=A0A1T4R0K2_9ACTN|nr:hypothetical protein SAMN02745673_02420 [Marinactinospora thermotolerans DSM 45154]
MSTAVRSDVGARPAACAVPSPGTPAVSRGPEVG